MSISSSIPYKQEIATFILTMLLLHIIDGNMNKKYKSTESIWVCRLIILVLSVYFTGVCHFTLLHRDVSAGMEYELSLFWSYRYVIEHNSMIFFKEVVYNIILLIPIGILSPLYLKTFQKMRYTILLGFGISCLIELCQLIFHIGLFEFDDIFNNTLGAYIGYSIFYFGAFISRSKTAKINYLKLLILFLLDAGTIVYFLKLWVRIHY